MNWGKSVTLAFVLFAGLIITMVTLCMKQDVNLVANNYYEEELAYQDQIDRINNYTRLAEKPAIIQNGSMISLQFPVSVITQLDKGKIHFFRPSEGNIDKTFSLKFNEEGIQAFDLKDTKHGLWKTKLTWVSNSGVEYYYEQSIVI
ncbi:FixH family protein [Reichenbachiella versicolor]|uniref:FixH family protein n=1 Tax=Reichenbachiella versicolor TaxID=1821036 RepID=UPI000D6EA67D|nr:FixH family protein [Reichenbachiella versicolor]